MQQRDAAVKSAVRLRRGEQRVSIIVRRAKRVGRVGQITPERGETSLDHGLCAFRPPSHGLIGKANCSTGEELFSDKDAFNRSLK